MNPTDFENKPLVDACGYAIYEHDSRLRFISYGTAWTYTLGFVLSIFAMGSSVNGFLEIQTDLTSGIKKIGLALIALLALAGIYYMIKKVKSRPVETFTVHLIIDFNTKKVYDGNERELTSLESLNFVKALQFFSSSSALRAVWPGGSKIVVRGSPFALGFSSFVTFLKSRGLMKS